MSNNSLSEIAGVLKDAGSVLLFSHESPDGDAIGSMVAAGLALKALGKRVDYRAGKDRVGYFEILDEAANFNLPPASAYDAALIVDCASEPYIHDNEMLKACKTKIVLDHHETNTFFADYNYVEPASAAASELVYLLINELNVSLSKEMATAIFLSIVTDTGNFTYSNTTARTHKIVSELYGKFDHFFEIAEFLKTIDKKTIALLKAGLANMHFLAEGKFVYSVLAFDLGYSLEIESDTDILTNIIRYIKGVEMSVLIRQLSDEYYKVSMRSADENNDVSKLAIAFGGGGHKKAAGFSFKGELKDLIKIFEEYTAKTF